MSETRIDEVGRPQPPEEAGEVATLLGFLDYQRATLAWKTRGLSDEQLHRHMAPTSMTLAGLLKHMALVEDYWFTEVVAGRAQPEPWASADDEGRPDWEWETAETDSGDYLRQLWAERCDASRAVVGAELAEDEEKGLSSSHSAWDGQGSVSLRWVLVHMVEEYARHNGHADLLREAVDGETGE